MKSSFTQKEIRRKLLFLLKYGSAIVEALHFLPLCKNLQNLGYAAEFRRIAQSSGKLDEKWADFHHSGSFLATSEYYSFLLFLQTVENWTQQPYIGWTFGTFSEYIRNCPFSKASLTSHMQAYQEGYFADSFAVSQVIPRIQCPSCILIFVLVLVHDTCLIHV